MIVSSRSKPRLGGNRVGFVQGSDVGCQLKLGEVGIPGCLKAPPRRLDRPATRWRRWIAHHRCKCQSPSFKLPQRELRQSFGRKQGINPGPVLRMNAQRRSRFIDAEVAVGPAGESGLEDLARLRIAPSSIEDPSEIVQIQRNSRDRSHKRVERVRWPRGSVQPIRDVHDAGRRPGSSTHCLACRLSMYRLP